MNAKISIVVPAYNIEKDVERCLDSILAQSHENIEVVVVDDGSTDGTGALLDRLAARSARVRVFHKENGGVTSARLRGVQEASGEWIGFVDGDDEVEPDMYERLLRNAENFSAQISHCGYQMVFPDGHVDLYYNTGYLAQQDKTTALKELLSGSRIEPGLWNKLFHKTLFHSLLHGDVVPLDIRINEDLLMNYRLFSAAEQTVFDDWCPYHYILRSGSAATARKEVHVTDPLRVRRIIRDDLRGSEQLYPVAESKYLRALISASSQTAWPEAGRAAKKQLRQEIAAGELRHCPSVKLRGMALAAAYLLPVYRVVRRCYDNATGNSHKYDL